MRHWWILVAILIILVLAGAAYAFLLPGLSVARQDASPLETGIATWLLRHSVPDAAARAVSPLGPHPAMADVRAGHDLLRGSDRSERGERERERAQRGLLQSGHGGSLALVRPVCLQDGTRVASRLGVRIRSNDS